MNNLVVEQIDNHEERSSFKRWLRISAVEDAKVGGKLH